MKYCVIFCIVIFYTTGLFSQTIVSTLAEPRNVVLEEYTGINCVNCPQGHVLAENVARKYPGRVTIINIHQGYFAVPKSGDPDYRTQWGDELARLFSVTSYPSATINRMKYDGDEKINRGDYLKFSVDSILNNGLSPVNIAAKTKWDEANRELEVYVEVYFTKDVTNPPKLNIVYLESGIPGPQSGAESLPYIHNHMLRDMLTGQWGEDLANYTKGTFFSKTYKYKPNSAWNSDSSSIAIFITQSDKKNIYTGITIPAITPNLKIIEYGAKDSVVSQGKPYRKLYKVINVSDKNVGLQLELQKSSRTPSDWSLSAEGGLTDFIMMPNDSLLLVMLFEMGSASGVGDAFVVLTENGNPKNPKYSFNFTAVSSNLEYIELDDGATSINSIKTVNSKFVTLPLQLYKNVGIELKDLKTIIWNCGTGTGLTSENASLLQQLMKNGIKLLICGSVAIPKLAVENYNHLLFNDLGFIYKQGTEIIANTYNLAGVGSDPIGDGIIISNLTRTNNGGFLQPLAITNNQTAFAVIRNQSTEGVVAVRSVLTNSRAVYLSFALEAVSDENVKVNLIDKCLKWLNGTTDVENSFPESSFQIYPNPATDILNVRLNNDFKPSEISIINNLGVVSSKSDISIYKSGILRIETSGLANGLYHLLLKDGIKTKRLAFVINK